MLTVIVFDATDRREGGTGARQVGLEVVVMEYKWGTACFQKVGKAVYMSISARALKRRFSQPPYQLKWILN